MPGRGHDLEVSLQGFIAALRRCFLPYCIPTKPLIWAFIKWVHGRSTGAPALASHRPSAGSKFSIYLCYERHAERTMGVTLRGALRDNCLTILGELWSFCSTFDLFFFCRSMSHFLWLSVAQEPCVKWLRADFLISRLQDDKGKEENICVLVFTCVFLICLGRGALGPHRCTQNPFHGTVPHVTRPSRWPADTLTWSHRCTPTNRQITFLKDTLRDTQKGRQMGSGKISARVLFSICKSFGLDSPPLLRDAWNVVQGFVEI